LGKTQCFFDSYNTNLLTCRAYEANLWHANALIDTWVADFYSFLAVTFVPELALATLAQDANAQKRSFQKLYPITYKSVILGGK
jgi:hypothetical protein